MKKIFLFFSISIFFFALTSCNGTTTTGEKKDSVSVTTDTPVTIGKDSPLLRPGIPAPGDSEIDIAFYELPENMAIKMKNWKEECSRGNRKEPKRITEIAGVKQAIMDKNPGCTFEPIQARFKDKEDEDFYCKINKFENKPGYCRVKNFKFWIYRVTCQGYSETYYAFITICPPPDDPPCN